MSTTATDPLNSVTQTQNDNKPDVANDNKPDVANDDKSDAANDDSNTKNKINLFEAQVNNENDALNILIGFLSVAQRRGAFAINESSKIFECVKKFQRPEA